MKVLLRSFFIISHIGFAFSINSQTILKDSAAIQLLDSIATKNKFTKTLDSFEVVISGTMKPVSRLESLVPVDVYTSSYFKKNPTPNIFDALQNVNGVRPQLNCNICSTGDIHINGLEGPYSMVLIDGMPIVSSLGTVYGLSGIPNSLVEKIEIVKGPASSLYGSEAVGGLINIITKKSLHAPALSIDMFTTSWHEYNLDIATKKKIGKKATLLSGINIYSYQKRKDNNHDNFTDVPLQNRISIFQKLTFDRKENRIFDLSARYLTENRWGGDIRWNKLYRGGKLIYGESIYTNRFELIGKYQLPTKEKINFGFSVVQHHQNSRYGKTSYIATQRIIFNQLTWDKNIKAHEILTGLALRYTHYDDNTAATAHSINLNNAEKTFLPGIFIQDEITLSKKQKILLGFRYDYNNYHGNIFTPRLAYRFKITPTNVIRINAGTGFRIVNIFTEEHAALTGARDVIILDKLKPEKSYNININFLKKTTFKYGSTLNFDATLFYTHFTNKIAPNYETNSNQIIYENINGYAINKGFSCNLDLNFINSLKLIIGGTIMDNTLSHNGKKSAPMLTEKYTGTWSASYKIKSLNLSVDYTGNLYSPMRLPLLNNLDPRKPTSPWWSIQNIQFTYNDFSKFEIYAGIKNLLNWTPNKGNPFIIARSNDPFDSQVLFDKNGNAIATPQNPYALTFDPTYVYAPNQGIRGFLGIRFSLKK